MWHSGHALLVYATKPELEICKFETVPCKDAHLMRLNGNQVPGALL